MASPSLPAPFSDISRVQLMFDRPSPIEQLTRLTKELDSTATIWIKRDDCNSGLAFGGNKVRKLEYVLADAIAQGADTLVTTGGVQSNHMRQTAAAAGRLGLKVALHPRDAVKPLDAEYNYAGNVQIDSILGAETFPVGTTEEQVVEAVKQRGGKPYPIPPGASLHRLGGLGYARWVFEVLEQEEELGVTFDTICLATGSGSTTAGIVAGLKLAEKIGKLKTKKRIIGFTILGILKPRDAEDQVLKIARDTAKLMALDPESITSADFELNHSFLGEGYGVLDQKTTDGIKELARTEGILVDPVYTGKAFTGLLHLARTGDFANSNVLFCHTGGQPALSAYPALK